MKKTITKVVLTMMCLLMTLSFAKAQVGAVIWQEDFNTFNTSIWSTVTGDGTGTPAGPGWGNQELVYYNSPNVYIGDVPGETGNKALVLEAKRENMGTRNFTSGKVLTKGNLSVKYGLVEMRIRVPNVEGGLWPAGWMLGTSNLGWPNNGEMDLMEMGFSATERTRQGYPASGVNNYVASNAFFGTSDGGVANIAWDVNYCQPYIAATPAIDRFLLYRVYWSSSSIRYTVVDAGVERDVFTAPLVFNTESEEFKNPFYFILNLTVGGTLTGLLSPDQITALFPAKMYIDYIKVSKWNGEGEVTVGGPVAETGTFGVFTDNTATSNKLNAGVSSDIWAWNNLVAGTTPAYEGSNVIAWATTAANTWFGGGIQARQATNMSNFAANGNLKFRIKIPANVNFKIGMTDNYTNEKYISFPANTNQYGLTRDGNWGQVTIPISAFGGSMAFQSMNYLFAIVSDGALPTSTFQIGIDDIVWEGGGGTVNVPVTGVSIVPTSISIASGLTSQLTGTVSPSNATNKNVTWTSSNTAVATVSSTGLVTGVAAGTANITVKTTDGNFTDVCAVTVNTANIPVTGVSIVPTSISIASGLASQLTATVAPSNATNKSVTWTSSNTAVATVSSTGLVTGVAAGTANITVKTTDGNFTDICVATITTANVPVTGVAIVPTSINVTSGTTYQLTGTVSPSNATNKSVTWTSSNTAAATVSSTGLVTGVAAGTANITVKTNDGNFTDVCAVTVTSTRVNLALNKTVTVSTVEAAGYEGSKAVDGNATSTRWSSVFADPQWIYVDLGASYSVNEVKITWEAACGSNFTVQISSDAATWSTMKTITANTALVNDYTGLTGTGRYVRIYGTTRATVYGYSIFELEVYGSSAVNRAPVANAGTDKSITLPTSSVAMTGSGSDPDGNAITYSWSQISGPNTATWTSKTVATPTISALIAGTYTMRLAVSDGSLSSTDDVLVVVNPATNQAPNVSITAPANGATYTAPATITLTASASDADGTISKVEYFNGASLIGSSTVSPYTVTWSSVVAGSYSVTAKATDNLGATKTSSAVSVTVNPASTGCSVTASTGDFKTTISTDASNPTLTFVPITSGAGSSVCILYYSTNAAATFPGYIVTPNTAYRITAPAGSVVYFYYTYSTSSGEKSTVNTKNSFTVGSCSSTLKSAEITEEVNTNISDVSVYPIPMTHELNLKLNNNDYTQLIITDVTGKVLLRQNISNDSDIQKIDVSNLNKGIYLLKLEGNGNSTSKMLVK